MNFLALDPAVKLVCHLYLPGFEGTPSEITVSTATSNLKIDFGYLQ